MAEFPALPLFTDAYLGDTQHLTLEEHGAYLKLLIIAWRSPDCSLPDDDKRLATMLGISERKWKNSIRPELENFFQVGGGKWIQKRLRKERNYVEKSRNQKKRAGKASALKRKETGSTAVSTYNPTDAQRKPQQTANNPHPYPIEESKQAAPSSTGAHAREKPPPQAAAADPPDRRAQELQDRVAELCGADPVKSPNWMVCHAGKAWLEAGYDPDLDIYPTVERLAGRRKANGEGAPNKPGYFTEAIREHHEQRLADEAPPDIPDPVVRDRERAAYLKAFIKHGAWPESQRNKPETLDQATDELQRLTEPNDMPAFLDRRNDGVPPPAEQG